ncbi:MAG: hypothetical protein ACFFAJ_16705 [Candidatus Hodarchaeota archaeon]
MALLESLEPNVLLHIIASSVSGFVLGVAGGVVFTRKKDSRLNQLFLGFFVGIGLHQIFDAGMTYFHIGLNDIDVSNLLRDFSILFLILGLNFGALAVLTIYFGDQSLFKANRLVPWFIIVGLLVLGGILGDNLLLGGYYGDQPGKQRELIGWLGITGAFIVYSAIIVLFLVLLIIGIVDRTVQKKFVGLIAGFLMIITVVFCFDISFVFPLFQEIIKNSFGHLLTHAVALLGALITVIVLWSPMKS